jgi:DNA-binding response OmpR family regulator
VAVVPDDVPERRVAALNAGADDCLSEPFHFAELRARIRVAVRSGSPDWAQLRLAESRMNDRGGFPSPRRGRRGHA